MLPNEAMSRLIRQFLSLSLLPLLVASAFAAPSAAAPAPPAGNEAAAPDELTPWPITRYEKMIRRSPFAPATAAPTAAATPSFAANLYVSGLAKIGDRDFVSISSRDQTSKFSLFTGETNSQDIQLVSVQWADAVGKSKVTVKKGTEFGVLEYDQALMQKASPAQPINPGVPPPPGFGQPPRPVVIPRPNQPMQPFQANQKPVFPGAVNPNPAGNGQPAIPTRRRSIIRNE